MSLTGLWAQENQARRLLNDIRSFGAETAVPGTPAPPENVTAVRWLDQRFAPTIAVDPAGPRRQARRTPRSTTRSSSTAGSCPSTRDATSRRRRP